MRTAHKEKSAAPAREPLRKSAGKRRSRKASIETAPKGPRIVIEADAQELIEKEFADQMPVVLKEIVNCFPRASKITVDTFAEPEPGVVPHFGFSVTAAMDSSSFWEARTKFHDILHDGNMPICTRVAVLQC